VKYIAYKTINCKQIKIGDFRDKGTWDIGSLKLFEDFLGLKLHLFGDFRSRKSSKCAIYINLF
jgi:hypothetical protein